MRKSLHFFKQATLGTAKAKRMQLRDYVLALHGLVTTVFLDVLDGLPKHQTIYTEVGCKSCKPEVRSTPHVCRPHLCVSVNFSVRCVVYGAH